MRPFRLWRYRSAASSEDPGLLSPALPTYCYLHPQKKICLCTCFKECLAKAKCARLTALQTEVLCSSVQRVQQEKGRWGAATGMGGGTTFSSPLPAPFPLQNCLPQGWMLAGWGTQFLQALQQTPLCLETAGTDLGWENRGFPNHPQFPRSLRAFITC